MERADKIARDIETLRESIRLDWADLSNLPLAASERRGLLHHVKLCALELNALIIGIEHADRLDEENA